MLDKFFIGPKLGVPLLGPVPIALMLGVLAAAIHIILHFFYRSRFRNVPWAAMKFLLAALEQTSRRLKFQELLLLVLRVAIMLLLGLALSRPKLPSAGGGDAV